MGHEQGIALSQATDPQTFFRSDAAVSHDDVAGQVANELSITMNASGIALAASFATECCAAPSARSTAVGEDKAGHTMEVYGVLYPAGRDP